MDLVNQLILLGAALLLVAILASVPSRRVGLPILLVFLALGMLAGEEGPGEVAFNDYRAAYLVGSVALAIILFDGGLSTRASAFRVALKPALTLATFGVLATAAITSVVATQVFGLGWLQGLLLGAIVGSTDAAAVFGLLHDQGLKLKERVSATLEIESGANDPMAVFLTVALVELVGSGATTLDGRIVVVLVQQLGIGLAMGLAGGLGLAWLINRVPLTASLYPLLALAGALVIFAATLNVDGSGFLAVYVAGLLLGNRPLQSNVAISRFHDGIAWLAQIVMFLVLGLLVTPSALVAVALPATVVAITLILVARPLAVLLCLAPFRFPLREQLFIGWVGLRGAVPIILALFPLLADLPNAPLYFNVAFFVVMISLIAQGWTLSPLARRLQLEIPYVPGWNRRLELDLPGQTELDLVTYVQGEESAAVGRRVEELVLPEGASVAGLVRDGVNLKAHHAKVIRAGDQLLLLVRGQDAESLDRLLTGERIPEHLRDANFYGEFVLEGDARIDQVAEIYGIDLPEGSHAISLDDAFRAGFPNGPVVGDRMMLGTMELVVREVHQDRVRRVGLKIEAG